MAEAAKSLQWQIQNMQDARAAEQDMQSKGRTDSAEPSRLRSPALPADAAAAAAAAAASSASGGTCKQPGCQRHCPLSAVTFRRLHVHFALSKGLLQRYSSLMRLLI